MTPGQRLADQPAGRRPPVGQGQAAGRAGRRSRASRSRASGRTWWSRSQHRLKAARRTPRRSSCWRSAAASPPARSPWSAVPPAGARCSTSAASRTSWRSACERSRPGAEHRRTRMAKAQIIDGKAVAAGLREALTGEVAAFRARHGAAPALRVVLVGDDPASRSYVRSKDRMAAEVGIDSALIELPETITEAALLEQVDALNRDPAVHGILVQLPLPAQIDAARVIEAIDVAKDVDGFHPINVGRLFSAQGRARPDAPGAVHAARLPDPRAGDPGPRPGRAKGRGGRPLQHRRQAGGSAAARRGLHGHARPLQDPRPAGRVPARRHPDRGGRPAGADPRRLDQARRHGDRRRRQPRRAGTASLAWWATSPSPRRWRSRARSRRCRAASAR